jgi:DNA-binding NarL/FixJ family response regulator
MRIVVIDRQPLCRAGFKAVISRSPGLVVVGEAGQGDEGLRLVDLHRPDLAAIDLALSGMSGLAAMREIRLRSPGTRMLALSASCHERDVLNAFAAGALAFMAKTDPAESFSQAIRAVARGDRFLGPAARSLALPPSQPRKGVRDDRRATVLDVLSRRERQVFNLLVRGFRNRDVAGELGISLKTVETHRLHINRKLACSCSADLIRFALANGLVSWSQEEPAEAPFTTFPVDLAKEAEGAPLLDMPLRSK